MKCLLFCFLVFIGFNMEAQVGVNTTSPNAQLDIRSSNQATPSNTDGILIPKVDAFPITNPTATQTGMMVYLTTTSSGRPPGFYYWNNATLSWLPVSKTDDDWYEVGSTNAPNAITDNMFHTGNVAIGKTTTTAKLDIEQTDSNTYGVRVNHTNPPNALSSTVIENQITSNQTSGVVTGLTNIVTANNDVVGYGVYNLMNGNTTDELVGIGNAYFSSGTNKRTGYFNNFNSGTGERVGLDNLFYGSGGVQRGVYNSFLGTPTQQMYGVFNSFNDTSIQTKNGLYNLFTNNATTNGDNIGVYNIFDGVGSSNKFGVRNQIDGNGSGTFWAIYNNLANFGTGDLYASHSILDGSGTGDKIGTSVIIYPSAGGNHIGILSNVTKPTGYSGYFLGRFAIGSTAANTYIMPTSRGTANQIMQTDGAGNVTWQNPVAAFGSNFWRTTGNSGLNAATDFIGTTDNVDLIFKRNNIIVGKFSDQNVGIGYNSLFSNTTGFSNYVLGTSLIYNTTGSRNTILGDSAGGRQSQGSNLVAIGYGAMFFHRHNDTSIFNNTNTAIGFQALLSEHSGSSAGTNNIGLNNTVVGYSVLQGNSSGSSNTSFGYQNMFTNTTGNNNTSLGAESLYSNSTGSSNIALGYQAGYNETGSNKLYIENSNSTTPLIYGEFNNDLLRVHGNLEIDNVVTPNNKIQVVNRANYQHGSGNQIFGTGLNELLVSTQETTNESAGVYADGNAVTIFSPGDGNQGQAAAIVYFLDEDSFDAVNTNPYDNTALKSYISPIGAYVQVSDQNKKENIAKIENATEKINQISGYTYQFKLTPEEIKKGDKPIQASGVLAQEVEKILPQAVQKNGNGDYFVDYAAITPLLLEAIKEQNTKIQSLEQRLKALEEKVSK